MINKDHAKLPDKRPEQARRRLEAIGKIHNLPLPLLKEGLSTAIDSDRIPKELHNKSYHQTTTHLITNESEATAKPFDEANEQERALIKRHRYSLIDPHKDRLIALQQAASDNGILITIPPRTKLEKPINILSEYDTNGFTHILIIARNGSEATITRNIKERRGGDETGLICEAVEIIAEEHARITYNEAQDVSRRTAWYSQKKARAGPRAEVRWYSHVTGGSLTKQDTTTLLEGKDAKSASLATMLLAGEQHENSTTNAHHAAANTTTRMHAKAIIGGSARMLHRGLIDISEESPGAEGYQQGDALLTGTEAEADIIPQLEIKNADVACSHGATVGNIEEEDLFYLQSRGLDEERARDVIAEAFLISITAHAEEDEQWKEEILSIIKAQRGTT
ncbi:SufD family Fe-S cluster assembly protein [Candidatus Woesearchaeota archaeon]|nr:SufD family Fe-S cluster assembly protein [Candidatus Woesearchaeota archaeon]